MKFVYHRDPARDQRIVRWSRALASRERLRILTYLVRCGETTQSQLGRRLRIAPNALSAHLAKLATSGLVSRRRAGAWSYCVARSPDAATTLGGLTADWLQTALARDREWKGPTGLHEVQFSPGTVRTQRAIFEAATAFTDLRRLQLLGALERDGETAGDVLRRELHMSRPALARHTNKLVRRGYLRARRVRVRVLLRLAATFKTPVHARLWGIVRATWRQG